MDDGRGGGSGPDRAASGGRPDKAALRSELRRRRLAVPDGVRSAAAAAAALHLLALPEVGSARVVALYAALPDEIDPAPAAAALRRQSVHVALPRVVGARLELVVAGDLDVLRPGYRGVAEPVGPAADLASVDVAVVPGVGFDRAGVRLGRGGGHYDRLLGVLPPRTLRVGYGFACQVVDELPREPHDQPVDVVVSEQGAHRTGARHADG